MTLREVFNSPSGAIPDYWIYLPDNYREWTLDTEAYFPSHDPVSDEPVVAPDYAIRGYVSSKLQRIAHHFDHVIDVNVILTVEKLQRKIEASIHVRGKDIFCESENIDMYAAIDGLVDKLDRTIIKHKEKSLGHRHDGAALKRLADK